MGGGDWVSIFGLVLTVGGVASMLVGGLMVLIAAFKESVLWGVGYIFVPLVGLVFVILHWDKAGQGFLISLAGAGAMLLGTVLGGAPVLP
jgi:hypothetical protein